MIGFELLLGHLVGDYLWQNDWQAQNKTKQSFPCLVHCILYTLAIWMFSYAWITGVGLLIVFSTHYLMDRYRLAVHYMDLAGQKGFKEHLAPWSVIIVDNTIHLLTLWAVYQIS